MTSISVALRKQHLGMDIEAGVVARMRRIAGLDGRPPERAWSWSGAVPAGVGEERLVALDAPGVYEVEIVLPSGRILNEQREVREGEDLLLSFTSGGAPREWLSWQELSGTVPDRAGYDLSAPAAGPPAHGDVDADGDFMLGGDAQPAGTHSGRWGGLIGGLLARIAPARGRPVVVSRLPDYGIDADTFSVVAGHDPRGSTWDALAEPAAGLSAGAALDALSARFGRLTSLAPDRHDRDDRSRLWRVGGASVPSGDRVFAALGVPGGVEIACLPLPWEDMAGGARAEVEIFMDASATAAAFRTRVVVRERQLGGLLAYLSGGNLQGARTILDDLTMAPAASNLLGGGPPLAVAAAGYVALATERNSGTSAWEECFRRLMERASWMPDGAILFARWKLRFAREEADIEAARTALRQAYRRGVPFFAAGVENLADALALASHGDAELEEFSRRVSAARARIDPGQAFTVVRLG